MNMSDRWADQPGEPNGISVERLPLILVVISLFLLLAFQTYQSVHDRRALSDVRASQEQTVQESIKLRHQLETLAGDTAQLAADGDAGARGVVEEMKKQGVNLNPPKKE
jgi:hypothetical protein